MRAGAGAEVIHINRLIAKDKSLDDYQILSLPGGFSYGDDVASGKIFANELRNKLSDALSRFIAHGKLIIGICNGFQVLVKSGILPGNNASDQQTSLIINDSGKFEDRWVYLKSPGSKCVWTKGLPKVIYLPVAHGEGKFVAKDKEVLGKLKNKGQVVFQYCDQKGNPGDYPVNPNGSEANIAGICDESGRIFGLMPHPERHADLLQHPRWTAEKGAREGDGLKIFKNGVEYARRNL
jgi:phosphoribosylformylglycinamidine synthase subunit PurQ / glutaminase